jgi:endonuclease-3
MSVEEIKEIIRPGLSPMKSKGSWFVPHFTRQTYGKVPQSFEYLEELPAVGHKTASVVMSQAFGAISSSVIRISIV